MAEIFPQDIENAILTRLKNNTSGIDAQITTINTTRSQSTPAVPDESINFERTDRNPEIVVDYESSDILDYIGDTACASLRKNCSITITAFLTTSDTTNNKKYASNYIEAISKCLQGWGTGNITVCLAESDIIADLYKDEIETTIIGGVRFKILINGGL